MLPNMRISQMAQDMGLLTINRKVVATIVHREACQLPGVVELGGASIFKKLFKLLGLKPRPRGVEVELGEGEVALNLTVVVRYGVSIPQLADRMRTRIAKSLKLMTGLDVRTINITIASVHHGHPTPQVETKEPPTRPRFTLEEEISF